MSREAAPTGGLCAWGVPLVLLDSIAAAGAQEHGAVVISGSHGGASAARHAIAARPWLTAFNDAGIGKDEAGIVGPAMMQAEGLAALSVAHTCVRRRLRLGTRARFHGARRSGPRTAGHGLRPPSPRRRAEGRLKG